MKESEDPESTRDFRIVCGRVLEVRERVSESGFERVDVSPCMVWPQLGGEHVIPRDYAANVHQKKKDIISLPLTHDT